jgi:hypothetical protein
VLRQSERNVEAIANMHIEFPEGVRGGLRAGMSGDAARLNYGIAALVPAPEPGSKGSAVRPHWPTGHLPRRIQHQLSVRRLGHLIRLEPKKSSCFRR